MNSKKLKRRVLFSHHSHSTVTKSKLHVYENVHELENDIRKLDVPQDLSQEELVILCVDVQAAINRGMDMDVVVEYCLL